MQCQKCFPFSVYIVVPNVQYGSLHSESITFLHRYWWTCVDWGFVFKDIIASMPVFFNIITGIVIAKSIYGEHIGILCMHKKHAYSYFSLHICHSIIWLHCLLADLLLPLLQLHAQPLWCSSCYLSNYEIRPMYECHLWLTLPLPLDPAVLNFKLSPLCLPEKNSWDHQYGF